MNTKLKGYLLGFIAAATYGMNPLFCLPLYADGIDPDSVLFFRYLFSIPILGGMLLFRGHDLRLRRKEIFPLALLGFFVAASSLTLFLSYNYMAAGIASTLLFVYPILVALIMALCFREKVSLMTALCIALAVSGIGLLYKSSDGDTLSLTGVFFVLLSALSYAIYIVCVNRPMFKNIPTLKITFYVIFFGFFLFFFRVDGGMSLKLVDKWYLWGNLVALGLFPTAISFLCTTQAIQYIGSTPTAILGAMEPVTAIFFGVLVFHEAMTPRIFAGIVLVILAVTLIIAGGSVTSALLRFRKLFPAIRRRRG